MNNNTKVDSRSSNIYISDDLTSSDISFKSLDITDGNTPINQLSTPFHLSSSIRLNTQQRYRNKSGFTGQSPIDYVRISTITDFLTHAKIDVCGSLFKDNRRGKHRMIESDVLIFDVDNHIPSHPDILSDESLHLTIVKFHEMFKDYDFLISTSLNHQKQKGDLSPRDKFHVFMGLGRLVTEENEIEELIKKLDYYIKYNTHNYEEVEIGNDSQDYSLIDGSVGGHSQVWGNSETVVYYNKGETIYDLLYQKDFSDNYRGYSKDSGRQKYKKYKEDPTAIGDYELNKSNLLDDWDYVNIISRKGLNHFYDISYKLGSGYFMGYCDFHDDKKASLQIFQNGGYNCLGCQKKGISALGYEALKCGDSTAEVRHKYINESKDITHQDFLIWLNKQGKLKEKNRSDSDGDEVVDKTADEIFDAADEMFELRAKEEGLDDNNKDEYFIPITRTGSMKANTELYESLKDMNRKHAILSNSGKINVMTRENDPNSDYRRFTFPSVDDFKKRYKNERFYVRKFDKKGNPIKVEMDIASIWELWEHRRQYDGFDFHPHDDRSSRYEDEELIWDHWDDWESATKENGWTGESVKRGLQKYMDIGLLNQLSTMNQMKDSLEGCNLYIQHLSENILGNYTGSNHKRFVDYLIGWMSRTLTHHGNDRIKIVPVLKGKQGCGKGMMISRYGELFGKHYMHVQDSSTITGSFNMQMMDTLLIYVNEAIFAGNKQAMNKMKQLITEDELQLEEKYLPSFQGKSHLRFIYSSNEEWVVPVEWDNRRYWMLECGDKYVNNPDSDEYFTNLYSQWKLGGKEHLFKYLTSDPIMDMASEISFEFQMPKTSSSSHQLLLTDDVYGWIHSILERGGHYVWEDKNRITKIWEEEGTLGNKFDHTPVFEDYKTFCRDKGFTYKETSQQLSHRINQISQQQGWRFKGNHRVNADKAKRENTSTTAWLFQDIKKITEIWVNDLFDGSYIDAGLAEYKENNLGDFTNDDSEISTTADLEVISDFLIEEDDTDYHGPLTEDDKTKEAEEAYRKLQSE